MNKNPLLFLYETDGAAFACGEQNCSMLRIPALLQGCPIERATPNCKDRRMRDLSAKSAATAENNANTSPAKRNLARPHLSFLFYVTSLQHQKIQGRTARSPLVMVHLKTVILFIVLIVTVVALGIYMSDWNLANQNFVPWFVGFMAISLILFVGTLPKKKWQKITIIVGLSALTGLFGFYTLFFSFFKCEEKITSTWDIDQYRISYGNSQCWAGPADESRYKLEEITLGGLLKKRIDIVWKSETENLVSNRTFLNDKNCIVEFKNGNYKFDLCSEKNVEKNAP